MTQPNIISARPKQPHIIWTIFAMAIPMALGLVLLRPDNHRMENGNRDAVDQSNQPIKAGMNPATVDGKWKWEAPPMTQALPNKNLLIPAPVAPSSPLPVPAKAPQKRNRLVPKLERDLQYMQMAQASLGVFQR